MKLYLDENMPRHLAKGFDTIQKPEGFKTGHPVDVLYLPDEFDAGIPDEEWIAQLAPPDCVLTQDIHLHRRKHQLALYEQQGLGMFFLRGPSKKKGLSVWGMVQILAKHWPEITEIMHTEKHPFAYVVSSRGIKQL